MPIYTNQELITLSTTVKSIMAFGPPFTGKTYSLWTLVAYLKENNLGPLHHFDLDLKCESLVKQCQKNNLLDHLIIHRLGVSDSLTTGVGRFEKDKEPFLDFQKQLNAIHQLKDFTTGKWKPNSAAPGAVVVDSLSTYCDIAMSFILGSLGHELNAPNSDARDDYGRAMSKIMETVLSVKSLPCITGWIAHAELMQSGLDGKIVRLPVVTGKKLSPKLAKEFNCVLYSLPPVKENNKEVYKWQVHGGENGVESAGVAGRDDLPTYIPQDYREIFK